MILVEGSSFAARPVDALTPRAGIKEYSEWPTIPQLYVDKEFVGGTDIMMSMHQDGQLAKLLEDKGVLVPAEGSESSS